MSCHKPKCSNTSDELQDSYLNLYDVLNGEEKTYVLRWTIRNYKLLSFETHYIAHHIRIGKVLHRLRFLKLDTKFRTLPDNHRLIYVYLGLTPSPAFARVSMSILKTDNEEMHPLSSTSICLQNLVRKKCYSGFIEPPEFLSSCCNPTVVCRITVQNEVKVSIEKFNSMSTELGNLFLDGMFSDLTISVGDRKFQVHSAILAARSPVFEAMLRNDMSEKNSRSFEIVDFEPDVVNDLLWYLYTGQTKTLTVKIALPLLHLADKYDIADLKTELEEFLRSNVSVDKVLQIFVAADLYRVENLREDCLQFIGYNLSKVIRSRKWKEFRTRVELVDDILHFMSTEFSVADH